MELKGTFKPTNIGVIPEQWDVKTIAECARNIMDYRGRTPLKLGMEWGGGDIPALSARNVKMGYIDFEQECYFGSDALYRRWMTNGEVAKDDIVITTEAPLGNVALIPDNRKYILSQRTVLLQPNPEIASGPFLFQVLRSDPFQRLLSENATGSTAQGIQRKRLETLSVVCPPSREQRAIAVALSDIDALLLKLDQLIAKKRDLRRASLQELISGTVRLPGFTGAWEAATLGDCLHGRPDYGINAAAVPYSERLPAYIRITDITEDGRFSPEKLVSVDSAESSNFYLGDGDIVFARTGASVGKSYRYRLSDGPLVFAGFLIRIRPDQRKLLPDFLAAYVTTGAYWSWVRLMSMRSGQPGINGNEYAQLPVPTPPIPEQRAIALVLGDMDSEIAALEARRDKALLLKQGMMQELLTGRIRLA